MATNYTSRSSVITSYYTSRSSVITSYNGRDPVGRKYLATESGQIITTEDGKLIIAVDSNNTLYTGRTLI